MTNDSFRLSDSFISNYIFRTPDWGPVGYVTYKRTYARPLDSINERHAQLATEHNLSGSEEWWLTVVRVVEGTYEIQRKHCISNKLRWDSHKAQHSAQVMYDLIFNFKFTPPGRGLWMMGAPVVDVIGGAALNNCAFVSTKDIGDWQKFSEPFCFLMDMSMLGVGVGFDTLGAGKALITEPIYNEHYRWVIEDTRGGWVDCLAAILDAYQGFQEMPTFDFGLIRAAGEPIRGFGGVAAGPKPLMQLVERLIKFFDKRIGKYLTSSDIVDIMNMIGVCVVSGNVRRSAELSIGDPYDVDFLNLKNYSLYPEENSLWRWASNNSVSCQVGMDYSTVGYQTATNGEPGYIWLDNCRAFSRMGREPDHKDSLVLGVNPCSEQTLEDKELCCLAEVYPSRHESYEEFERTLKYCYLYTKTVTLVPTHNQDTNAVMLRNRRIGVSLTGVVQAMGRHGTRQFFNWCEAGYETLRQRDNQYSRWLCVPKSIKITSVKPSGTVSLLPGVTPGIHFPHSEYYFRVIRFASNSSLVETLRDAGYRCEQPRGESNTAAIYFPVKEDHFTRGKSDVSMWEQLELAAQMQHYWSDNAVSITVTFKPDEAKDIPRALQLYETRLKAVSFLPLMDHGYEHAPYQTITYSDYLEAVGGLDLNKPLNSTHEKTDSFCDGDKCEIPSNRQVS